MNDIKNELDSHDERDKYTLTGYVHLLQETDGEAMAKVKASIASQKEL